MQLNQYSHLSKRRKMVLLSKIARTAMQEYDLSITGLHFYAEHSNVLYKIKTADGKNYLLKVARPGDHSPEELRANLNWLHNAHRLWDLDAIKPVPNRRNELLTIVDVPEMGDNRCCSLYHWIEGVNLRHRLNRSTAYKWGALLASLHTCAEHYRERYRERDSLTLRRWDSVFYWDDDVIFNDRFRYLFTASRLEVFKTIVCRVERALSRMWNGSVDPIIIHADLHPDNIKVHHGTLYALDFEDNMWGYPVQDISIALLYIRERSDYGRLRQAFMDGYRLTRPWPETYPGEIETFFMGRLMMFANFLLLAEDLDEDLAIVFNRYEKTFTDFLNQWDVGESNNL